MIEFQGMRLPLTSFASVKQLLLKAGSWGRFKSWSLQEFVCITCSFPNNLKYDKDKDEQSHKNLISKSVRQALGSDFVLCLWRQPCNMLQVEQALAKTRRRHNGVTSRCFLMFAVRNLCTRLNIPNHSKPVSIVSTCVLWGYLNLPGMFTLISFLLVILVFISNLLHPGVPGRVLLRHIREQPSHSCSLGGWKRHVQGRSVVSQGAKLAKQSGSFCKLHNDAERPEISA